MRYVSLQTQEPLGARVRQLLSTTLRLRRPLWATSQPLDARPTAPSQTELALTKAALTKRNPKCYYAWHHRKWVVSLGYVDLREELALCAEFLALDERNFHCWTYRRCVLAALKSPASEELAFTDDLIARNCSNGSAWHQRSRVLLREKSRQEIVRVLRAELDKVREALHGA